MSINKNVAVFVGLALAVAVAGVAVPVSAAALTQAQIDAIIGLLQSFGADQSTISNVQTSLTGGTPTGGGAVGSYVFNVNLTMGSTGADVMNLQKVLNSDVSTQVAASGVGSAGNESSYFGGLTKAAVIKFQNKYGITPAVGYVGPITRAKLNSMGGVVVVVPPVTPPPVSVGTGLTVTAAQQPMAQLAPLNAARVPFTKVTFTAGSDGDVKVNSLVVERGGPSADADISSIVLLDESGNQVGLAKTLNSAHQVTLSESFTVKAGQSRTMTLALNRPAADADSSSAGAVVVLSLVAVNTSATVTGSLPIAGTAQTMNVGLTIGSVTNARGPLDPAGAASKNVGTTGYVFSSIKVTAGSTEDVLIKSIRWNQASSAASSDLANIITVVDGVSYPTIVDSTGKYYTSVFGDGIKIDKGFSKELSIKGDIAGGSGRTAAFNIEKTTDLNLVGSTYGYGITPPTSGTGFSAGSIWYAASTISINAGSLTVTADTSVAAQNIAINLANQSLGGFSVEVKGEPVSVSSMIFNLMATGNEVVDITNVSLIDGNGAVLAGPVDGVDVLDPSGKVTFSDSVTFPVGITKLRLQGKLGTDFVSNDTVQASTTPSSQWTTVTGQTTGQTITPSPTTAVTANTMTVKAAALTINVLSTPVSQTVVAGGQEFIFAKYQLDATAAGEDVRLQNLLLDYSAETSALAANLTSCQLWNGSTILNTGSNAVNPSAAASSTTFTFDSALLVSKGTTKTLDLKCNIASGSTGDYYWGISATQTVTGVTSGQSATITQNSSTGQKMTMSSGGTLSVALDAASPSYKVASAGTTGNTSAVLRFSAVNEDIRLSTVALQITSSATSTSDDVTKVTLWDGLTQVGEAYFNSTDKDSSGNWMATSTLSSTVVVPKDSDKLITVKIDFPAQSTTGAGKPGALVAIDHNGSSGTYGVGSSSGTTIYATGADTAAAGIRVFKSVPTITTPGLTDTVLSAGRKDLFRFNVTASPQGQVGIQRISVRISTSSATASSDMVDAVNAYAYEDSSYSSAVSGIQSDGAFMSGSLDLTSNWASASTQFDISAADSANASTTVVVPAGATRYFVVRGDISNLAGASYSVATVLEGDASYSANVYANSFGTATTTYLATSTYLFNTSVQNDFIWRPFSTTTAQSMNADDFANGYGLSGLPSGSSNSQTLNK